MLANRLFGIATSASWNVIASIASLEASSATNIPPPRVAEVSGSPVFEEVVRVEDIVAMKTPTISKNPTNLARPWAY